MNLKAVAWYRVALVLFAMAGSTVAEAEEGGSTSSKWRFGGEMNSFYTDNVAYFSAAQRLSLREDPTQPLLDIAPSGRDVVFEPSVFVERTFQPIWGALELNVRAQGFICTDKTEFNHGTYGAQLSQALPSEAILRLRYHYGPNLLLGSHTESRLGEARIGRERVTTHFGTIELEKKVRENVVVRILSRYGTRTFNEQFAQRDSKFWTIGAHMEWEIRPGIEFMIGYHYERGLANGRKQPEFGEDTSSFTHYVEAEIKVRVTDKLSLKFGADLERNSYTSGILDDDFRGALDKFYQGEFEARYALNDAVDLTLGYIRGQGKLNFERDLNVINTVSFGSAFRF